MQHTFYIMPESRCQKCTLLPSAQIGQRIREHKTNENSTLFSHCFLTDNNIRFSKINILTKDKNNLEIKERCAYSSLNANSG